VTARDYFLLEWSVLTTIILLRCTAKYAKKKEVEEFKIKRLGFYETILKNRESFLQNTTQIYIKKMVYLVIY